MTSEEKLKEIDTLCHDAIMKIPLVGYQELHTLAGTIRQIISSEEPQESIDYDKYPWFDPETMCGKFSQLGLCAKEKGHTGEHVYGGACF